MSLLHLFLDVLMEKMKHLEHEIDHILIGKFQINTICFIIAFHFLIEGSSDTWKMPLQNTSTVLKAINYESLIILPIYF